MRAQTADARCRVKEYIPIEQGLRLTTVLSALIFFIILSKSIFQ